MKSDGSAQLGTRTALRLVLVTVTSTAPRKPLLPAWAALMLTRRGLTWAAGGAATTAAMVPVRRAVQVAALSSFIGQVPLGGGGSGMCDQARRYSEDSRTRAGRGGARGRQGHET